VHRSVARELYRFLRRETPTLEDFTSHGALGKRMRRDQDDAEAVRRWHDGISVFDDLARASEVAAGFGFGWIATITLEDPAGYEVSQYGKDRHHYTIFGEPEQLMALVSAVRPILKASGA
jgi:hypothetical protein